MKYAMEGWHRDGEICHSECASALDAYVAFFGLFYSGRLTRIIATGEDGHKLFDAFFPAADGMEKLYAIGDQTKAEMEVAAAGIVEKEMKRREKLGRALVEAVVTSPIPPSHLK